jgi:hypothetical protein
MKEYGIEKLIMLSFLKNNNQVDVLFGPQDGCNLLCDGSTIWITKGAEKAETITMANAIPAWLEKGSIQEIKPEVTDG